MRLFIFPNQLAVLNIHLRGRKSFFAFLDLVLVWRRRKQVTNTCYCAAHFDLGELQSIKAKIVSLTKQTVNNSLGHLNGLCDKLVSQHFSLPLFCWQLSECAQSCPLLVCSAKEDLFMLWYFKRFFWGFDDIEAYFFVLTEFHDSFLKVCLSWHMS